ncbi:hypothetical protein TKK_0000305 [Trichogramma kaykai]
MKTHVINKYSPTEHEKIDQLFRHCSLGHKKPSKLLNEMQVLGQGYVLDQTLMLMWYRLLPNDLAILLDEPIASSNAPSLIKKADRLHERLKPEGHSHISAIEHKGNDTTVDLATAEANAVVAAIGKPTQTRNRSRERNSNSESRSKSNTRYGPDHDYCCITTDTFNWIADQLVEIFPNIPKSLLYIPRRTETPTTLAQEEGGTLYWYYKEQRKYYDLAKLLPDKGKRKLANQANQKIATIDITKLFSQLLCDPERTKYKGVEVCKAWDNSSKKRLDLLVEKKVLRLE